IKNKMNLNTLEQTKKMYEIVNDLRNRDVYYTKADRGNSLVILNKNNYDNRMMKLINDGPYEKIRGPLTNMKKEMKEALEYNEESSMRVCWSFIWSSKNSSRW